MVILSKLIYKFGTIPIKVPVIFFADINELILKFIWKCKGCRIAKTILETKSDVRVLKLPDFESQEKVRVIKTGWYRHGIDIAQ